MDHTPGADANWITVITERIILWTHFDELTTTL